PPGVEINFNEVKDLSAPLIRYKILTSNQRPSWKIILAPADYKKKIIQLLPPVERKSKSISKDIWIAIASFLTCPELAKITSVEKSAVGIGRNWNLWFHGL